MHAAYTQITMALVMLSTESTSANNYGNCCCGNCGSQLAPCSQPSNSVAKYDDDIATAMIGDLCKLDETWESETHLQNAYKHQELH